MRSKVLILEPDYDESSIDHGCGILAQKFQKYFSDISKHRVSGLNSIYDDMNKVEKTRQACDPIDDKRINDAWDHTIKCVLGAKWAECADACMRLNGMITPQFQIEIDNEEYVKWGQSQYEGENDYEGYAPHICVSGKCDELPILHANCWRIARFNGHGCSLYHSIRQPDGTFDTRNVGVFPEPPRGADLKKWCFDVMRALAES